MTTLRRLRVFLADDCQDYYDVHKMNDKRVLHTAARYLGMNAHAVVIEPSIGWAVQVDEETAEPVQPISVEPEPDISHLFTELQQDLNAMVAEQQQKYNEYEAQMAGMNDTERALFYSQNAGGAVYDSAIGDTVGLLATAVKGFPKFYKGYLKTLWKVAQTPNRMAKTIARAISAGNMNPIKEEIDKIVEPVARTVEQAMEYKSMLTILFNEPVTHDMLYKFADQYWQATHPIERTKMGASAVTDIVVTVVLAIVSAGVGAAANIAAKSTRLVKVAKLLQKIAAVLKKTSSSSKILDRGKGGIRKTPNTKTPSAASNKGVPKVNNPKPTQKVESKSKKEYGESGNKVVPKTTTNNKKSSGVQEESVQKPVYKNKEFPTTTKPSCERGGKPFGERTTNKPNSNSEYKRSIKRENEAADLLANEGYKVEQNPKVKGSKDPDYRIEGKIFDCYAPKSDNPRSIITHIADDKIGKKQTERIVLNLTDSDVKRHALRQTLNDAPIDGLKEVIIIDKNNNVIRFFP